jgi:two-component system CheB/CheR fusion protein
MSDDLVSRIRDAMETVTVREDEARATDGRWYRVSIRPHRTTDQRLDGVILSFLDIDILKQTVLAAECARDYAQSIVDTVPVSLVVLDGDRRVVSANARFNSTFANASIAERADLFDLAAGSLDCAPLRRVIEAGVVNRTPFHQLAVQCALPGLGPRDLLVAGSPIQGDGGKPMLLLAIEDVTERRLLEASEKQARVDAERANRAKDLFLATLSHELRTPLSTILMSSQLLQRSETEDSRVRRACAAIERAARNQARLIDDLLDISRIVSGKLILSVQAVDIGEVVRCAVDVLQTRAEAKQIRLELNTCPLRGSVHGDPTRLQQVVTNLLDNAIKFTPPGGRIGVRLESLGNQVRITVTDTGSGIAPDVISHLFDRFVQAESSITRANGGLGLGLAIVRHLVSVHGGEITVESPGVGHGATFIVTLPVASEGVARAVVRKAVVPDVVGVRVLLIDDDDDTREVYSALLVEQGAEVHAVSSAAEGIVAVEQVVPDVILCDIAMVGEDGYSFVQKLRSNPIRSEIPAAAFTALASEEDRMRALASGFRMHLAKPIGADELTIAVAALAAMAGVENAPSSARSRDVS